MARRLSLCWMVIFVAACGGGGGGGGPIQTLPIASVAVSFNPDPLTARPCDGCGPLVGELEALATVVLRESAGVSARIAHFDVSIRSSAGAVIAGPADRPNVRDTIPAGGTLNLPFETHFPGGAGNSNMPAVLRLEVGLVDGNGHTLTVSREVTILPP